jgi:hypothetical protein
MSFPLAIAILALFQCSNEIEPVREHKPTKVKATQYTQKEPMYVIKESYNQTRLVLLERNILLYYIKWKVEITTKALMSQGPLSMALCSNTHTFAPYPLNEEDPPCSL